MKMRHIVLFLLLVGLLGCAGLKAKNQEPVPAAVSQHAPADDLPLLPRESAKEAWERSQRPLPPLPVRQKAAPAPQVTEEPAPTLTPSAPEISIPSQEPTLDTGIIASPEVDIPAIPSGSGEVTPELQAPEISTEPQTSVIPWGEETEPVATPLVHKISFIKVTPENLTEVLNLYRGSVLFVNCWGIDCGPCVEELPHLEQIYQQFKDRGLRVLAINSDVQRRWPDVERFVKEKGFTFDVALKAPGPDTRFHAAVDSDYGADPFTVIYNSQGKKIYTIADALTLMEWKEIAHAVLAGRPIPITREDVIRSFE